MERAIAENPKMDAAELRQQRFAIQQFSLQRDRLLAELLGNGKAAGSPWDVLTEVQDIPGVPPAPNAPAGPVANVGAIAAVPTESQLDDAVEGPR